MNSYQLISAGYEAERQKQQAIKQADLKNQQEKEAMQKEQEAEGSKTPDGSEMPLEDQVKLLSMAVLELTEKLNGNGEMK
ncbi:hypothetical protein [Cytobacillus firmus]|uniref:hypothetical protein n=1 Tax=Cytobacillus firmus TaxID=1399 RepID=UPI001CFCE55D|nr:hypothetical protein [Cytobacillus firmus]